MRPRPKILRHRKAVFSLILLLAAAMRLVSLRDVPPGLAQDEVLDAVIAMLIRQGQHALFFREGFGHEPLYHYLAAPFAPLLGENFLAIRLPSAFLGLLLVALTLRWARREFGGVAAAAAGLGLAVSWWPIVFSRIGIRPILEPVLLVLAAWFWPRRPRLAGLFLGLSVYSYTAARVVFLIPLLFSVYLALGRRPAGAAAQARRSQLRAALVVLGTAAAVALPLYLTLRADPSLQQRVGQLMGPIEALREGDWRPLGEATLATLGVFSFTGDPRWTYAIPGRPLFDPLTALFFYGGLLLALGRARRQPRYALALIWLAVALAPSAVTPDAPSTVRLVGAMPVVYLLPGLAVAWLVEAAGAPAGAGRRLARVAAAPLFRPAVALGLVLLAGVNLARTIGDGFVRWPAELETRLRYQTVLLDIGRQWQRQPAGTPVIADAFFEPIDHESLWFNVGRDLPARWVQGGGAVVFPTEGDGRFYVPEFAPLEAVLREAAGLPERPLFQSTARPSFAVYALPAPPAAPPGGPTAVFDGAVRLLGHELAPRRPGEPLRLLTYWQVEPDSGAAGELPWDLAIFVHLLDPAGTIAAQWDGLDAAAATLRPGDSFIQLHTLDLPDPLPPGPYSLELGLYVRGDGRRLTHPGEPADRLILAAALAVDGP